MEKKKTKQREERSQGREERVDSDFPLYQL